MTMAVRNHLRVGIIGGGVLPEQWQLAHRTIEVQTAYGTPSSPVFETEVSDSTTVFSILRHGHKHEKGYAVNYLANVAALHEMGCDLVISLSLAGSLVERFSVGEAVVYDDVIDFRRSIFSFHLDGSGMHCAMAPLVTDPLRTQVEALTRTHGLPFAATMVVIEGPRYSTRAESRMYSKLGGELICQTIAPECFLVREKDMDWFGMCLVTDSDTRDEHAPVSTELIYRNMRQYERSFAAAVLRIVRGLQPYDRRSHAAQDHVPHESLRVNAS
jgi:5'-methylthioadenosine phosphorylase